MAGCVMLVLIAMFSFWRPPFHQPQLRPGVSILRIVPSFEPRPDASSLQDVIEGVAEQAGRAEGVAVEGQTFTATNTSDKPIDPRATRYFDRANEFTDTQVVATEGDGKTLKLTGSVSREYFLFGTDSTAAI